jgi:hypothetical protein
MTSHATITVYRPRDELERLWQDSPERYDHGQASFVDAPGDRGTEIHIRDADSRAKAMDALRRFKQVVETGVIARSEAVPEGELAERKIKKRPAQPLDESELEKAGI